MSALNLQCPACCMSCMYVMYICHHWFYVAFFCKSSSCMPCDILLCVLCCSALWPVLFCLFCFYSLLCCFFTKPFQHLGLETTDERVAFWLVLAFLLTYYDSYHNTFIYRKHLPRTHITKCFAVSPLR